MELRKRIGIVMGGIFKEINKEQLSGVLEQSFALGFSAFVFTLNEANGDQKTIYGEENLFSMLNFSQLDGIVYMPYTFTKQEYISFVQNFLETKCSIPVVAIGSVEKPFPGVWFDDRLEICEIVRHLIQVHKCRDILFLTGPKSAEVSERRLLGYQDALREAGIPCKEENAIYGDFWVYAAQELAREIATGERPMPEAVACANDQMAIALCDALLEKGISVPEQIRVTGYDGTVEAFVHEPQLTTYRTCWKQLGRDAMRMLYEKITGINVRGRTRETGNLLTRDTCGCRSNIRDSAMSVFNFQKMESNYLDSDFTTRLYASANLRDFIDKIFESTYIFMDEKTWGKETYTLCLCEDWDETLNNGETLSYRSSGYTDRMILAVPSTERITFPTSQMVPDDWDNGPECCVTYFTAVHFQERCFGYALLRIKGIPDGFSQHYVRFCREINNGLMFLCTQNHMRSLAYHHYLSQIRDELTGLYNAEGFPKLWKDVTQEAQMCNEIVFLLCLNLSGLQQIQELCGSVVCDKLMTDFANILQGCCENRERCIRMSTVEFAVIGTEKLPVRSSSVIAARLSERFDAYIRRTEYPMRLTIVETMKIWEKSPFPDAKTAQAEASQLFHEASVKRPSYSEQMRYQELSALRNEIYQNPEKDWSTTVCAERLGLSTTHFQRIYQSTFGISCAHDIRKSKMSHARQLLLHTKDTLQEIAQKCGYDYSHFMRIFRSEMGMTPTAYRRGGGDSAANRRRAAGGETHRRAAGGESHS